MPRGRPKTNPDKEEGVRYSGETCINHIANENFCIMYAGERKWYNWVLKMIKEHPDEIEVIKHYDTGFRSIEVKIPYSVMEYIRWPTKYTLSDEEKEVRRNRIKGAHRKSKDKEE